ncbi:cytochrome P450 [Glonium stellatum]|uniref:Cytochrome P450 n=1 Tax=Glonium stellatum TaxID=574774 RepID=A0A8E2F2Q9_9PEZI|nr:cytochrome P450 [Glonium stellatum]
MRDHQDGETSKYVVIFAISAIIIAMVLRSVHGDHDSREPPVVHPRIPLIGHIIGLMTNGAKYWSTLSARYPHPIFTVPMLSSRTYVITSPSLASQAQRASKTLLFNPLIVEVTGRMVGFDNQTMNILRHKSAKEEGRSVLMDEMHEMIYSVLSPTEIKDISVGVLQQLTECINEVTGSIETDLFLWVRSQFTMATTYAIYGPENPFVMNPSLEEPFWDFEEGLIKLIVGIFPSLTARKAYYGRERCIEGMIEYIKNERYRKASKLIQERVQLHSRYNISETQMAKSELGMLFGALVNAGVTTFWVLNNIFSRPELLAMIRDEIEGKAMSISSIDGRETRTISFSALKSTCPLINSVYRETLRLVAPMSSSRLVTVDTMIADRYLLRSNSVVQIAGGVIHEDPSIWGADAADFNPRRFLTSQSGTRTDISDHNESEGGTGATAAEKKQVHPAAFRAFGGGSVFCPGRHFAQVEIISFVAGVVMAFDLAPPMGTRHIWFDPPKDEKRIPIGVMKPVKELQVQIQRRLGMEGMRWVLEL